MAFGIDGTASPPVDAMRSSGATFICRYLSTINSQTFSKVLGWTGGVDGHVTTAEALRNARGGIATVSNFEWFEGRPRKSKFDGGVEDARCALAQHLAAGGPPQRPIYFSVDEDTSPEAVAAYFKGVNSVLGVGRTGVYAGYKVCRGLRDMGLVAWTWQAFAWSTFRDSLFRHKYLHWDPRNNIEQYQNDEKIGGFTVDFDRSRTADFGQWYPLAFGAQPKGSALARSTTSDLEEISVHIGLTRGEAVVVTSPTVSTGGKAWICLSSDFGDAQVRIAVFMMNRGWTVLPMQSVPRTGNHISVFHIDHGDDDHRVSKVSARWERTDGDALDPGGNPIAVVALDIIPHD